MGYYLVDVQPDALGLRPERMQHRVAREVGHARQADGHARVLAVEEGRDGVTSVTLRANAAEADGTGSTYAPPRAGTDLLAYERRRAAALVAAYQAERTKSRERRLRDDREALDRDRAALDRERQLLALERLRGENRNAPARSAIAALVVATGLARNR